MNNRASRRSSVHRFRKEAAGGTLMSYLVASDDARIAQHPTLQAAILHWYFNIEHRRPFCAGCRAGFAGTAKVGAFLLHHATSNPSAVATSGLCRDCWSTLSNAAIERIALRIARTLMPGARFSDG